MTVYTQIDHPRDFSQCLPSCKKSFSNRLKRLLKVVKLWVMRSHQRRQLAKLDEVLLKDIGISKVDAEREISKSFWH